MPFLRGTTRGLCALVGLALVGCYSPYRPATYGPYGPGIPMYQQGVPVQPQFGQPQFGPPVGTPTLVDPNGGSFPSGGSTFPSDGGFGGSSITPVPDPGGSGSFPSSNPGTFPPSNGGGFGASPGSNFDPSLPPATGGGSGLVPPYREPGLPPDDDAFRNNTSPFRQDGASFRQDSAVSPVDYSATSGSTGVRFANHLATPAGNAGNGESMLAYDAAAYRWLRGVVDYDDNAGVWVLIYDLSPTPTDVYRGQISLVPGPLTARLKNNDVILVEGQVDASQTDPGTGKPRFRVNNLQGPFATIDLDFSRSISKF